jgi:hypothetical protein
MGQPVIIWPPDCGNDYAFGDGAGGQDYGDAYGMDCAESSDELGYGNWVDCTDQYSPDGTGLYCCNDIS